MNKHVVRAMKEEIKAESEAQRERKRAYRAVVVESRKQGLKQAHNRPASIVEGKSRLRHLFAAYALARGRDMAYVMSHVEGKRKEGKEPLSEWRVKGILERFEKSYEAASKAAYERFRPAGEEAHASGPQ